MPALCRIFHRRSSTVALHALAVARSPRSHRLEEVNTSGPGGIILRVGCTGGHPAGPADDTISVTHQFFPGTVFTTSERSTAAFAILWSHFDRLAGTPRCPQRRQDSGHRLRRPGSCRSSLFFSVVSRTQTDSDSARFHRRCRDPPTTDHLTAVTHAKQLCVHRISVNRIIASATPLILQRMTLIRGRGRRVSS